jgi:hypothetical protein
MEATCRLPEFGAPWRKFTFFEAKGESRKQKGESGRRKVLVCKVNLHAKD